LNPYTIANLVQKHKVINIDDLKIETENEGLNEFEINKRI
jgi:hypothetical protein